MKVNELIIGIKYNGNFNLLDKWGSIIDSLLYSNNNYFNPDYFPRVTGQYTTERALYNDETGNYLRITGHEIIYRHALESENFESEYKEFSEKIENCIEKLIIKKYDLDKFRRIGIVFTIEITDDKKYKDVINSIVKLDNINDIRFSKKDTTAKGRLFGCINDYTNKIYTIAMEKDGIYNINYDYQYCYNPIRSTYEECKMKEILTSAKNNMQKDISNLLGEIDEGKK